MIRSKGLLTLTALTTFAALSTAANADPTTYYYKSTTVTQTTTPVSQPVVDPVAAEIADRNSQAMSIHDQAVYLAHQATILAQRGDKQGSARMAAEAQGLFNQSFNLTHPTFYAHRTGQY
jgi:hypothetical protein